MNLLNTPAELQAEHGWVGARLEMVEGRLTKVPYCAFEPSRKASTTNPATWSDFATVLYAVEQGAFPFAGFVIRKPYVGIDLDKVRNPETGVIASWALDIITKINSYTEISCSGTGIHIICTGSLPPGSRRRGHVEMYDSARYFVMTGDRL